MSAASDKRNERAHALGFSSYSQQYRAKKAGYEGRGFDYNAALRAVRSPGVTAHVSKQKKVYAAQGHANFKQLLREALGRQRLPAAGVVGGVRVHADVVTIERRGDRYLVTIETRAGDVVRPHSRGGFTADELLQMWADDGEEMWCVLLSQLWEQMYGEPPAAEDEDEDEDEG